MEQSVNILNATKKNLVRTINVHKAIEPCFSIVEPVCVAQTLPGKPVRRQQVSQVHTHLDWLLMLQDMQEQKVQVLVLKWPPVAYTLTRSIHTGLMHMQYTHVTRTKPVQSCYKKNDVT